MIPPHPAWQRVPASSGWGDLQPSCWHPGRAHIPHHSTAMHAAQSSCSIPLTEAITSSDGWFAGLVGPAAPGRFPVLLVMSCRRGSQSPQESREALAAVAACRGSLWYPSKGCCGRHVPVPPASQLYLQLLLGAAPVRGLAQTSISCSHSQHLGRAEMSPPAKPCPRSAGSHPLPSASGVSPLPSGSSCLHHWRCCRLLPALTIAVCTPQLSPAACRWTRGTASTTRCGGTTTKESPNAGPSSTAAAGATSTASTARRSASCTVGSTQGQVGMALAGLAASPPGAASSADAEPGGMMLVPHLSSDTPLLLSTDAHGVASGKLGGQSKA